MRKHFKRQLDANPLIDKKKSGQLRGKTIFGKRKQKALGQNLLYFYICLESTPKLNLKNFVLHSIVESELGKFENEFEYCLDFGKLPVFKRKEETDVS